MLADIHDNLGWAYATQGDRPAALRHLSGVISEITATGPLASAGAETPSLREALGIELPELPAGPEIPALPIPLPSLPGQQQPPANTQELLDFLLAP